jgi:hypothetical protein
MTSPAEVDPLAGGTKTPAVSFASQPIGTVITGTVTDYVKSLQSRDYTTGELKFWPDNKDGSKGKPVMCAVVNMIVDNEERSLWATIPSALFQALKDAQSNAGERIGPGGTLAVKYTGDKPNENPRLNPAKQYAAIYTPPVPNDAFADSGAAAGPAF